MLKTVYAPNAVVHMLRGKAVLRALRGHMLPVHLPTRVTIFFKHLCHNELYAAFHQYDSLMDGHKSVEDLCMEDSLDQIKAKLDHLMTGLTASRTSKLWLQYMEMIKLLRNFLKAERTGN